VGNIIRHNEFVVNILEEAISKKKKKGCGKTSTAIFEANRYKHRS
jgi:flavin reductase (DIM6/NTAB) family NADH-FMN oxidoreductase RutF